MASTPTLSDLKTWLGVSGSSEDAILTSILAAALEWIERYTGRVYAVAADSTRYFDVDAPQVSSDRRKLFLFADLAAITSIVNGNGETISTYRTLPPNPPYYAIEIPKSESTFFQWGADGAQVAVTGKWGASASYPDDLFTAALALAAHTYRSMLTGAGGTVTTLNTRRGIAIEAAGIPPDVLAVVQNARRR